MDNYPKTQTDHIAKVMRLDPRKEALAAKIYGPSVSWCNCREDHRMNPPCDTVVRARELIDDILAEGWTNGLILGVSAYTPPPEPKYDWETDDIEDILDMDFEDHAKFIRAMGIEELDAFIEWRREEKLKRGLK